MTVVRSSGEKGQGLPKGRAAQGEEWQEERTAPPKAALFAEIAAERMLAYAVPVSWLDDVLEVAAHLPPEADEAAVFQRFNQRCWSR